MEQIKAGMLAESRAGHDTGTIYVIIGFEKEYVYLADGKIRLVDSPKKKNKKHIQVIKNIDKDLLSRLSDGQTPRNEDIKRVIKLFKNAGNQENVMKGES